METNGGGPLATVFAAPGKYIQGRGAIERLGEVLGQLGAERPLILSDPIVGEIMGDTLDGITGAIHAGFGGECSPEEIDRVSEAASENGADAIVGIGGGKTMDTAKAVAHPAGLPLVIVPTIASTDAPTSSLSVVYDEEGAFKEYRFFGRNPDAVIVDTAVIAGAPVRFLVAGIGDGLSTYFEADSSSRTRKQTMAGGAPTQAAIAIARLCYDTLLEHGLAARLAVEQQAVTPAVEKVVEANTLLSGLGFESGGLAAAHSVHNGLTVLEGTHHFWHGEKVAFGVISMLMLEERPAETVEEVVDFCLEVGLPVALEDIGLEGVSREELETVAEAACAEGETIHNEPFDVYPQMVVDAMLAADAFGRQRRALLAGEAKLPAVAH
ncbi:MAG TPA: glycerol dehydrogenase [Rubrobacteraceae bacterium]|nr:glycerol dehydrogenase [Rubrobacteraceae bacterium]